MDNGEFQKHTQRVDELVQRVSALPESEARTTALELLQSLMDLHGAALSRVVELLSESGDAGHKSLSKVAADPLVCGLLVLYGIHPVSMEERVRGAIEKLNSQFKKKGTSIGVVAITDTVVRVSVCRESDAHGSPQKLRSAMEQAILEAAPEVVEIIIEGLTSSDFILLNMIQPAKEEQTYEESAA